MRGKDPLSAVNIKALREEIAHYCDLGTGVIGQARRRVLDGEQVPTSDKIYSIFEPHTDLIKRGKVRTPVEFGHKVFLAESAGGLITQYEALKGNPVDEIHVAPSLRRHRRIFPGPAALRRRSRLLQREQSRRLRERRRRHGEHSAARWLQDAATPSLRTIAGVQARPALPCRHLGVDAWPRHEGCRAEGAERFALFVGAAVLANNLMIIGELLTNRSRHRRKTNRQFLG
jgi:IS5 family transposase